MPVILPIPVSRIASGLQANPWGFLGMIALVAIVERGVLNSGDRLARYEALAVRFAVDAANHEAPKSDVLALGDSTVKFGFDPKTFEAQLGVKAYNLAVPGTPTTLTYAMLRRVLKAGATPKVLVIGQTSLAGNAWAHVDQFGEFLSVGECMALAWSYRDTDLLGALLTARALPSLRYRKSLQSMIQGKVDESQAEARWQAWAALRGAELNTLGAAEGRRMDPAIEARLTSQNRQVDTVLERYLRRLTDLAHEKGITVIWLIPPFTPKLQAKRESLGLDGLQTRSINAIHSRMSGVILLDARRSGYRSDDFFDELHLNSRGASKLTREIAATIADRFPLLQAQ